MSLFCYALLCVRFTFAIILRRKRKLVALLLLSDRCIVTITALWLFLVVPSVGLQCVIVVFPDHTHFLFETDKDAPLGADTVHTSCLLVKRCDLGPHYKSVC